MDDADPPGPERPRTPVRALVVDDSAAARRLVRALVEGEASLPVEVVGEAGDGAEAVDLAAELEPDLVVLDLTMPRMDGLEALPRIRERCPDSRVVVYSSRADRDVRRRTREAGAAAHVEKGTDLGVLLEALHEAAGSGAPAGA